MSESELSKLKLIKGDNLLRAHNTNNTLSGVFDSYDANTDVFTFLPSGTGKLKSEFLTDIMSIIKFES